MAAGRDHNTNLLGLSGYPSSSDDENDESQRNPAQNWQQTQTQTSRDREEMMRDHNDMHDARRQRNSSLSDQGIFTSLFSSQGYLQENAAGRHGNSRPTFRIRRRVVDMNPHRNFASDPLISERGSLVHEPVIDLREPPPQPSASADIQNIMAIRRLAYRDRLNRPRHFEFQIPQQSPSSRSRRNSGPTNYGRSSILSWVVGSPYGEWRRSGRRSTAAHTQTVPSSPPAPAPAPASAAAPAQGFAHLLAASPSPPSVQEREDMDVDDNDNNNQNYEQDADNAQFERLSPRLIAEPSDSDNLETGENAARISSPAAEEHSDPVDESNDMPINLSDDMPADESADEPGYRTADEPGNRTDNELAERPTEEPCDNQTDVPSNRSAEGDDDLVTNVEATGSAMVVRNNSNISEESRTAANDSMESQSQSRRNKRGRQSTEVNPSNDPSDVTEFNEKLLRLLECPVCLEWMEPPMWQCRRGHLVCGRCRARLAACPVCRTGFSSVRNRAMEAVAELLRYPCRHGCGRRARLRRRAAHEASCQARCYRCPAPACATASPYPLAALTAHVQRAHAAMMKTGQKHNFSVKLNTQLHEDWLLLADSGLFHLRLDVELRTWGIVLYVVYIGPKCLAKDYNYEVTVVGQHNGRKLVYSRSVHSDLECSSLTVTRQDCFHLTLDQAVNYLRVRNKSCERDRTLDFTVEISKRVAALTDNSSVVVSDD